MIRQLTVLFSAAILALPVWADQQKPLQTIEEAYGLMLGMVTDYPADIKDMAIHFPNMAANTDIRFNQLTTTFDLPKEDFWRGNIAIANPPLLGTLRRVAFSNLTCTRIGQPTLVHLRQLHLAYGREDDPKGKEGMQHSFAKKFADVPDGAVAMQSCFLFIEIPSRKTEAALYQNLIAVIGDDFSDTKSAAEMQGLRNANPDKYITYYFKGQGSLRLNGAVITRMQANIHEGDGMGMVRVVFVAISYLVPFIS